MSEIKKIKRPCKVNGVDSMLYNMQILIDLNQAPNTPVLNFRCGWSDGGVMISQIDSLKSTYSCDSFNKEYPTTTDAQKFIDSLFEKIQTNFNEYLIIFSEMNNSLKKINQLV